MNGIRLIVAVAFSSYVALAANDLLDNWTWRNSLPTGVYLNGIAFLNGQRVAVGNVGTIVTSTDGTNWVSRQSSTRA